jgi:hypothetical protein
MSDKAPVQHALADKLSNLVRILSSLSRTQPVILSFVDIDP